MKRVGCSPSRMKEGLLANNRGIIRQKPEGAQKMQELSMNEVEQVNGGFIVVVALALFDVGMIAYDAYQLKHIND